MIRELNDPIGDIRYMDVVETVSQLGVRLKWYQRVAANRKQICHVLFIYLH